MSSELNSQLSAFVDDELTPEESELFVRRLCRDEDLRRTAACYAIIGDVLRGETAVVAPGEFASGVMMAVQGQSVAAARKHKIPRKTSMRNWGFGLAASVALAAVALMTLPGRAPDGIDTVTVAGLAEIPEAVDRPAVAAAVEAAPALDSGGAAPAAVVSAQNVPIVMPASAENRARLNNLLLQHLSSSGASRQQGLVGFRNVGFVTQTEPEN